MELKLDHLYRETHHWDASVAWWERLGFSFVQQWGEPPHRAGTLQRDQTSVVLAETDSASDPKATVFLATDDVDGFATLAGANVVDTHWGTRMVTITDPDGREYNVEPGEDS